MSRRGGRLDSRGLTLEHHAQHPWDRGNMVRVHTGGHLQKAFDVVVCSPRFSFDICLGEALTSEPVHVLVVSLRLAVWIPYDVESLVDVVLKGKQDIASLRPEEVHGI